MLFRSVLLAAVVSFGLWACASGTSKEEVDKAEKKVFAVHDTVMGRIGDMLRLNKLLRRRADSLNTLQTTDASATVRIEEEKAQIRQLTQRLTEADSVMNIWMAGYNGDTLQRLTPDQALGYLNQQQTKIDDVKDKINGSIGQAQTYLKK